MKDIELIVKRLFRLANQKYGMHWRNKIRDEIFYEMNDDYSSELRKMESFFLTKGYKIIGAGSFRLVFGWKDLVIKVDCKPYDECMEGMQGNRAELKYYKKMLNEVPLSRYFICPILKVVKVETHIVLVYPKVKVYSDSNIYKTEIQLNMQLINELMFDDMHEGNVGRFCNGLVAVDFNFGSDISASHNLEISNFAHKYKDFWGKYICKFEKTVRNLKETYALV